MLSAQRTAGACCLSSTDLELAAVLLSTRHVIPDPIAYVAVLTACADVELKDSLALALPWRENLPVCGKHSVKQGWALR